MENLKKNLPVAGTEGLQELRKIAVRFEEKEYTAAASQADYLRKISLKMLTMETKSQTPGVPGSLSSNPAAGNHSPPDPASIESTAQMGQSYDWQEDVFQKIKAMKEMYLPELSELYQRINLKFQQPQDHTPQPKSYQFERYKISKNLLERMITFLQVPKNNIIPAYKDKLALYEKQILNVLNTHRPKKPISSQMQGQQHLQAPGLHPQSMQQQQQQQQPQPQSQSQLTQLQQHDDQMNPQMQPINMPASVTSMQPTSVSGMQHGSLPSLSGHLGVPSGQPNMINSLQSTSNLESGQGGSLSSLQQGVVNSLQQNTVSMPQQANMSTLSQSGVNTLQFNINNLQSNSSMLQHQHLKQQLEQQQLMQTQQLKQQLQQRQMHPQLTQQQKQHILFQRLQQLQQQPQQQQQQPQQFQHQQQQQQQQLQQLKQRQQSAQLQAHQIPQIHQMNEVNDLKVRQGMGVKQGIFPPHHSAGQHSTYHQQLKTGVPFSISSPQHLQAASPQLSQHSSPQIDQQSLLTSLSKAETPLHSTNSPFVVPSPSPPMVPSPMPGDAEKQVSGVSLLSNSGNTGHPQTTIAHAPPQSQSLAIGTPGISASPLLAEFSSQDGNHGAVSTIVSGKSGVTEQPLEHLLKVPDYLRKISLKMPTMETKSETPGVPVSLSSNPAAGDQSPPDPGTQNMQSSMWNQGQAPPMPVSSHSRQEMLGQSIQNPMASAGMQNSEGLPSVLPSMSSLIPSRVSSVGSKTTNLQCVPGISQNTGSNLLQGSVMHSHIQQPQQNLLQTTAVQSTQQSLMQMSSGLPSSQSTLQQPQPPMMQSTPPPGLPQNQQPSVQQLTASVLQQHPQSGLKHQQQAQQFGHQQTSIPNQPQAPMSLPSLITSQQQPPVIGQQTNAAKMQQNMLLGQQTNVPDMEQQQPQRLLAQVQQNNLSNMQQPFGSQNNVSVLQQLLGAESGISNIQSCQHLMQMLRAKAAVQQQLPHQTSSTLLPTQWQRPQSQLAQQQLMSQLQSQPGQLQRQPISLQRDVQQRIQSSGGLVQPQNTVSMPHLANMNTLSQNGLITLQSIVNNLQPNFSMLQEQAQMMQTQQPKQQLQQRQMLLQLTQQERQQILLLRFWVMILLLLLPLLLTI